MQRHVSPKGWVLLYLVPAFCMGAVAPIYWSRGNLLAAGLSTVGFLGLMAIITWTLVTQRTAKRQSRNTIRNEQDTPK